MKYTLDGHDNSVVSALIDEKIHNAQYRKILKMRFIDKMTYQEIADHKDIKINSPRHVGKIIKDYAPLLKSLLK